MSFKLFSTFFPFPPRVLSLDVTSLYKRGHIQEGLCVHNSNKALPTQKKLLHTLPITLSVPLLVTAYHTHGQPTKRVPKIQSRVNKIKLTKLTSDMDTGQDPTASVP